MLRSSKKDNRHPQACSCLLEAYRTFPADIEVGTGCASPDCPVRNLDGITLHQFLEAIRGIHGAVDDRSKSGEDGKELPIFRVVARRRKQRKSRRTD